MFARLRENRQRLLGVLLLAMAMVALFGHPSGDWKYLQLVVVIVGFAWGYLLVTGVVGVHATAARHRRTGEGRSSLPPREYAPVEPRTFRYGSTPWRRAMAAGTCVTLGIGQFVLGAVLAAVVWSESVGAALVCGGIALGGLVLCDYARRYLRVCIRVDAEGLTSQLYYRAIRMRWGEVVALVQQRCVAPMVVGGGGFTAAGGFEAGRIYLVYSDRAKIWFSNSLVDAETLMQIISRQTGLSWEGESRPQVP